jgi:hypothetical protein
MAWFSSANEKKRWFLNAASIQRSAINTRTSTLALSLGFPGRAGMTVVSIVPGQVQIGRIDIGFVPAGTGDAAFQIVRHQDLRDPAEELKGADMGFDPVRQALGCGGLDITVVAGPHGGDEDLGIESSILPVSGLKMETVCPA